MKMIDKILLALLFASFVTPLSAQKGRGEVDIRDIQFEIVEDIVEVSFTIETGRNATKSAYTLTLSPVIERGLNKTFLPTVKVEGNRAQKARKRYERAIKNQETETPKTYYTTNNQVLYYHTALPLSSWMRESKFLVTADSEGCCSSLDLGETLIAEGILRGREPEMELIARSEVVRDAVESTGDRLSNKFSYLLPVKEYDIEREAPRQRVEDPRERSMSIYFRAGSNKIDLGYMNNRESFVELLSVIRALTQSDDSRIVGIVVSGLASPEGGTTLNRRLAQERADAAKEMLLKYANVKNNEVLTYNGGIDWDGLREMVLNSDLVYKDVIVDIIDNTPIWDSHMQVGRLSRLMKLDSGRIYRTLLRDYFPKLRQAAYVKIYYVDL